MSDTDAVRGTSEGFADIMSQLDYPMYIVTTRAGDERSGCLVGFTTQTGIDPARFLVAISNKNHTFRVAQDAEYLAVHVLSPENRPISELFGEQTGDEIDKFSQCEWSEGPHGLPILDGAAGWFVGRVLDRFDLGDHMGFLLDPEVGELREKLNKLLTFRDVSDMEAGHGA